MQKLTIAGTGWTITSGEVGTLQSTLFHWALL